MRIFIDIGHPAHVHYFRNFIIEMQKHGHEFSITARNKEVSHLLLRNYNIPYFDRGKGADNLTGKALYALKADNIIYQRAKNFKVDVFLSFASPYAAHVSRLLKKPHISFTDSENARLGILSFSPFTDCILTPKSFKGCFGSKQVIFNGFMELCYLHPKYFRLNQKIKSELGLAENEKYALLRFVSWKANHDIGQSGIPDNMKIKLVRNLEKKLKVFISSESKIPEALIKNRIQIAPEKIHDVLGMATIYIGEGATMASESAMLGTPSIYVNSLTAGTIEEQQNYGLLFSYRNFNGVLSKVEELLDYPDLKKDFMQKRIEMLNSQIDVTSFMVWFVENYPKSFRIMRERPEYEDNFK
jgi:predicted glycosyltransferase